MRYYYKYDFISPQSLYALIKEELNSYFISGAVDDTLFSLWTNRVLKKLTKGTFPIRTAFLEVQDKKAQLPEEFKYPREVWALEDYTKSLPSSGTTYAQVTASRIDTPDYLCNPCSICDNPQVVEAVYKITSQTVATFVKTRQLSPGKVVEVPGFPCIYEPSEHVYEIEDRTLHVSFDTGKLYLVFYAEEVDEYNFSLVPDDVYILEAIEAHIKAKLFRMLLDQASDESFNQLRYKSEKAEQEYLEKFVIAQTWMKKETKEQKQKAVIRQKNRFNAHKFR
jgi:predicted nucleic acid binding AN1-type Zn finger protein